MALGNVRGEVPIHGFLTATDLWRVTALEATARGRLVTSRLEFYRQPAWMRQWPFAHTVEITYRLADGVLEVATAVENLSDEPMPLSIGFHPYFQLTDTPRDDWQIAVARQDPLAPRCAQAAHRSRPSPPSVLLPRPRVGLRDYSLDEVFTRSRARRRRALDDDGVGQGAAARCGAGTALQHGRVWAPNPSGKGRGGQGDSPPAERNFICFEPMAALANALNLAQRGQYARAAVDCAGRDLARELLGAAERLHCRALSRRPAKRCRIGRGAPQSRSVLRR